ncbi:MAG: hypothetical protein KC656_00145 [Myxococcales bacterium]|nr:hypothetical protein [Myxococcales bacterium]MCB9672110.1 hypothetical protein [Alphaproteobacteria bacterium]MCB9691563.1 hypothetical protein [Alphaproteobacteria bacterium]
MREALGAALGGGLVWTTLACGGAGGLVGGGSEGAQSLCKHLQQETECPCVSLGAGSRATIDGIEVQVDVVKTWEGLSSLPEITNLDERNLMKKVGNHALVLELTYTNTKPVKSGVDFSAYIMDGDGEGRVVQPYNSKVYSKGKEGWIDLWDDDDIGPNKTRKAAFVYAVPKSAVEGSKLVLRKNVKRPDPKDPRGRMKYFAEELFVLDLGPPT